VRVLLTGSSGLVGVALTSVLEDQGHVVTRLARSGDGFAGASGPGGRPHGGGSTTASWDPACHRLPIEAVEGHDAVVHLAGEPLGARRWSAEQRRRIWLSRTVGTRLLATTLAGLDTRPGVLVSASAVGYYGDRDAEELTESSGPGNGFLAELCQNWEAAATPAAEKGIRLVSQRLGIVLSTEGGALARQLLPFKLGLGGPLGTGRQYVSWISLKDAVRAISTVLGDPAIVGPVNVTAPNPVTNAELAAAIGAALHRPARVRVPRAALALAFGTDMARELLLSSQRAQPAKLLEHGFRFDHPEIQGALRAILGR
jgi:uncharacterized protein